MIFVSPAPKIVKAIKQKSVVLARDLRLTVEDLTQIQQFIDRRWL